jgi:hypothetical protein
MVSATSQTAAPISAGTAIKPAVTFFIRSKFDPLTDTLIKLERKHDSLKRCTLTIHESNILHEYERWATHDLANKARSLISEFLKWRSEKDNAEMHLREQHRRANDLFKSNGNNSNGTGSNGNGAHHNGDNGNGSNGNGNNSNGNGNGSNGDGNNSNGNGNGSNGNGEKEFIWDAIRRLDRRGQQKTTEELAEQYTQKLYAILDVLERRGEFNARESLLSTPGLQDSLIVTNLEERSYWI